MNAPTFKEKTRQPVKPVADTGQATILRESLKARFFQVRRGFVAMLLMSLLLGALLWSTCPPSRLVAWLLLSCAASANINLYAKRKAKLVDTAPDETIVRLNRSFTLQCVLNGLTVGSGVWWVAAASQFETQLLITFILCIHANASLATQSTNEKSYLAIMLPNLSQLLLFWIMAGSNGTSIALAVACVMFFLFAFVRQNSRVFAESVRIRLENVDLLAALSREKREVERALNVAEEANLAKSRFLAAASHDMRQPLHALVLWADLLRESLTSPAAIERADKMLLSVDSLDKMFSGLLDLSRFDSGNIRPDWKRVSLQKILAEVDNDYRSEALAKGLELRMENTNAWAYTDPLWLKRILRNLVVNAIKYTERGSVAVLCEESADSVRVIVRDTGIGIKREELDRIFEEYYQLHNPARDRTLGVGLGLAIVKRACDLLGHPIDVRSEPGAGSDFILTIPKCKSGDDADEAAVPIKTEDKALENLVVVVVEDDKQVTEPMCEILLQWKCVPIICENAEEAMQSLSSRQLIPQIIISDYRLRDTLTGDTVIRELRRRYGPLPAAIITGEVNIAELQAGKSSEWLVTQKPLSRSRIKQLVLALDQLRSTQKS